MIKNMGNRELALKELENNPAVSHLFKNKKELKAGALSNLVVTVKDAYATKDAKTQSSSKILENFEPGYNAKIIDLLENEGADIIAKTHMDELALGGTGQFNAYGKILNPLDNSRMIGGSSSGSAATMTESIGVAIGSDTGDSVRLPASYIGKVGFKPSYGAISRYGLFAFSSSLDTIAYFAHNVNDIIEVSKVLYQKDEKDMTSKEVEKPTQDSIKPNSIGVLTNDGLEEYQNEEYQKLIDKFKDDGIDVKEFKIDDELLKAIDIVYSIISYSEVSSNDSNLTGISFGSRVDGSNWDEIMHKTRSSKLGELVQKRFTLGALFLQSDNQIDVFQKAQKVRRKIVDAFNAIKDQVDILAFPATEIAPIIEGGKKDNWTSSYLIHANFAGSPSISIPWAKHNEMPFNLSLDGKLYEDKKLLSHSLYIEELLGGSDE